MVDFRRRATVEAPSELLESYPPWLASLLAARGILHPRALIPDWPAVPAPNQLKGVEQAVALLESALEQQSRVLIVGDYDADGATSCALGVRALRAMGFREPWFLVPDRVRQGYGLSAALVDQAKDLGADLILTVDNGIASVAGVERANQLGIPVVVTDHHLPGLQLPAAAAIVNPNQPGCPFPEKSLAGVGVLFYLLLALRARLRETGWFEQQGLTQPDLARWLDIVALGTVADLVPLGPLNRLLVARGIALVRSGQGNPGIRALMQVAGRDWQTLTSSDLGFAVGPRINAAGRLEDISLGIRCLLSDSDQEAGHLARSLDEINRERRARQDVMQKQAESLMDELHDLENDPPPALCVYRPDWHEGVIGLLASRLREKTHRPTLVLAQGEQGVIKASGRSIPGFHLRDALERVHSLNPGLIRQFGGHAMAAGLTLEGEQVELLTREFCRVAQEWLTAEQLQAAIHTDGELPAEAHVLDTAQLLEQLLPWGQSCPEPLFENHFKIDGLRWLKEKHLKLSVSLENRPDQIEAIWFFAPESAHALQPGQRVKLAYRLSVNRFGGRESLQLMIEALSPD